MGVGDCEDARKHLDGIQSRRRLIGNRTLGEIIASGDDAVNLAVASFFEGLERTGRFWINPYVLEEVLQRSEEIWGVTPAQLTRWSGQFLRGAQFRVFQHALDPAAAYFALAACPAGTGTWIGKDEVQRRCPDLSFDDGLLTGSTKRQVEYQRDCILVGPEMLQYHPWILHFGLGLSGGFLDRFLREAAERGSAVKKFGLAIDPDIVLDRRYRVELFTREFIRGPKGLSIDQLRDPSFPEDPTGTVTEHLRVDPDSVIESLWRDVYSLQVMWSCRDGIKTIQMEELVPPHAKQFARKSFVANRYLHARWSIAEERFVHFDGAVRVHQKARYTVRFGSDLRANQPDTKADTYLKLFRIDAPIDLSSWSYLAVLFFRENELVTEILDGLATT